MNDSMGNYIGSEFIKLMVSKHKNKRFKCTNNV